MDKFGKLLGSYPRERGFKSHSRYYLLLYVRMENPCGLFKFLYSGDLFAFFRGDNMSVQEIIDLLSDSVSEGKLNRNSQVTVMEYDHKGDGLKRIDLNHFKIEDKKITFSSFLY